MHTHEGRGGAWQASAMRGTGRSCGSPPSSPLPSHRNRNSDNAVDVSGRNVAKAAEKAQLGQLRVAPGPIAWQKHS